MPESFLGETLLQQLESIRKRFMEVEAMISAPEAAQRGDYGSLLKEHGRLARIVEASRRLEAIREEMEETRQMAREETDREMRELAEAEAASLEKEYDEALSALIDLLVVADDDESRDVIVEIRSGTGGLEASLFAADLCRMYRRYAERKGWKVETISSNPTDLGGYKEVILSVEGTDAYGRLRFESGVHRVQRVPKTEASGRIHTSAASVAVLPEAEPVEIHIEPSELEIQTYHASGPGGQHVNKTSSAVRITHLPTGITVACEDERSQHKNRERAMRILRSRLYDMEKRKQEEQRGNMRRNQIGSGDRSEKIRTYNFPQNRVTDHRINLSIYRLEEVLDGDLDEIIDALRTAYRERRLAEVASAMQERRG